MSLRTEITPRQDVCLICKIETNDGSKIVQLTEKGSIGMNKASKERGDEIVTKSGHTIHEKCRRTNINPIVIKGLKRKPSEPVNEQPLLRSEQKFDFKENCFFCGASVVENTAKRKTFDVHAVRTMEFQKTLEQICTERKMTNGPLNLREEYNLQETFMPQMQYIIRHVVQTFAQTEAFHRCFHHLRWIKISVVEEGLRTRIDIFSK